MTINKRKALNKVDRETPIKDIIAYYQPIVAFENQRIVGYEALARKVIAEKVQAPIEWLPQILSEDNGSERLTKHMLELVLDKMSQVSDDKYISVNFEIEDIDNANLHQVIQRFEAEKLSHRLVIELTERGELCNCPPEAIQKLKELNFRLAFDDFGSGAARLLSLIDFQPNVIKLDKIVTDRINESAVQSIIKALSEWCQSNGTKVLAEGIEEHSQINHCISAGISYGQGYYFGQPAKL
ncbi:EAL domain-containing protein [Colwellia demingiae]|uniref:EAL domain-containing protein n=1 Tax=Colwellia demingiae TaxID=89401 RepID=A0A5C6QA26_9GAMM|nr:EAL domain-containing protein [Colwellia demingiae]TWX65894.1 EAL domain-containing protein [Colwellia demingiae]